MGVLWPETAVAEGMFGVPPLVFLYKFGLVEVAKDIATYTSVFKKGFAGFSPRPPVPS